MNNFSDNFTQAINYNEEILHLRIPALVILSFVLPFGVLGNASVIYIYGFRLKKTNIFIFITLLAISDITSCLIGIPLELYRIRLFYAYPIDSLCRLHRFVLFTCYIYSTFLLLIISIERYIKVCKSSVRQMRLKAAKYLAIVAGILAILLALPSAALHTQMVYMTEKNTVCYQCIMYLDKRFWKYEVSVFIFSVIIWIAMLVFYMLLLRTVRGQEEWRLHERNELHLETVSASRVQSSKKLSRTNRTVLYLSLVYVCTCSFYFSFVLIRKLATKIKDEEAIHYFLFVLNESWVINVVFNPIVYGFLNTKFRIEIYKVLKICSTIQHERDESVTRNFDSTIETIS